MARRKEKGGGARFTGPKSSSSSKQKRPVSVQQGEGSRNLDGARTFSLIEEARNTEDRREFKYTNLKHSPVKFISGGQVGEWPSRKPQKKELPEGSAANATSITTLSSPEEPFASPSQELLARKQPDMDIVQSKAANRLSFSAQSRSSSISSEDVVVFEGRGGVRPRSVADTGSAQKSTTAKAVMSDAHLDSTEADSRIPIPPLRTHPLVISVEDILDSRMDEVPISNYIANVRKNSDGPNHRTDATSSWRKELQVLPDLGTDLLVEDATTTTIAPRDSGKPKWWSPALPQINPPAPLESLLQPESDASRLRDADAFDQATASSGEESEKQLIVNTAALVNEGLAQRLAKQEELGLGSNEVLLFGGEDEFVEDPIDFELLQNATNDYVLQTTSRQRSGRNARGKAPVLQSREGISCQTFDIMDRERASISWGRNKTSQANRPNILDSDIETHLQLTWENNRAKKKARRQQREELRVQGLLGSDDGTVNLKAKYRDGITRQEISSELEVFILSSHQTLAFPATSKHNRKFIHDIANRCGMRSKSSGVGLRRYPQVYKTMHTQIFDMDRFGFIVTDAEYSQNGRRRQEPKDTRSKIKSERKVAVSYRDGEIIGAGAAAIASENRGRAMLEKMGWSSGTALGAANNKGNLEPIMQQMKATRLGLG